LRTTTDYTAKDEKGKAVFLPASANDATAPRTALGNIQKIAHFFAHFFEQKIEQFFEPFFANYALSSLLYRAFPAKTKGKRASPA